MTTFPLHSCPGQQCHCCSDDELGKSTCCICFPSTAHLATFLTHNLQQEMDVEESLMRTAHKATSLPPHYTPGSPDPVKKELSKTATSSSWTVFFPLPWHYPRTACVEAPNLFHPNFHLYKHLGGFCKQLLPPGLDGCMSEHCCSVGGIQ